MNWRQFFLGAMILSVTAVVRASDVKQPMIGESAPAFDLESLDGKKIALADLKGKYVVLHFGTGW